MAPIHDWRSYFGDRTLIEHAHRNPSSMRDRTLPIPGVALGVEAVARVSGSVWIADCPLDGCPGAEIVNFDDPKFFCCECRNVAWGYQVVKVKLPAKRLRSQVEAALLVRPASETRHWNPLETVTFLRAENKAYGVA